MTPGGGANPGRPGPFRPGGRGRLPWSAGGEGAGPSWRERIDFGRGRGLRRGETDGRGREVVPDAPGASRADPSGSGARPERGGRVVIELFSKPGCHLCDDARAIVERVAAEQSADVVERDISDDAALAQRYGEYIPVVVVDGREHATWRVDARMLTRAVRAARAARRARGR